MTPANRTVETSVVVLNFDGLQWLDPCLSALAAQTSTNHEVVLVDNASTDGSVALVRERFPEVRIVALAANLGFAAGNNAGAREAGGRYLAFLNNDTAVEPGWLDALRRPLEADPTIGATASRIIYMDRPDLLDSAGDGYLRAGGGFKRSHGQPVERGETSREVFGACGAAFMIRRNLFEELGGFDDDFFMVYEDVDLSYRVRLRGFWVWYAADAVVRHAGSASLGQVSRQAVFYGQRNLEWTYLKNTPWPLLLRSLPSHVLYDFAAALGYARHGRLGPFVAGKWAALRGLPGLWRKRRAVQRSRRASSAELWRVMDAGWIRTKRNEKRFDFRRP